MKTHNRPNVTQAMSILRLKHCWTLQRIANAFGVTREAVRLRIGNTGHIPTDITKGVGASVTGVGPSSFATQGPIVHIRQALK